MAATVVAAVATSRSLACSLPVIFPRNPFLDVPISRGICRQAPAIDLRSWRKPERSLILSSSVLANPIPIQVARDLSGEDPQESVDGLV